MNQNLRYHDRKSNITQALINRKYPNFGKTTDIILVNCQIKQILILNIVK